MTTITDLDVRKAIAKGIAALIAEASEEHYAAGWMSGIEFMAWDYVIKGAASQYAYLYLDVMALRTLSDLCNGWVRWDAAAGEAIFVEREEWERLFKEATQ